MWSLIDLAGFGRREVAQLLFHRRHPVLQVTQIAGDAVELFMHPAQPPQQRCFVRDGVDAVGHSHSRGRRAKKVPPGSGAGRSRPVVQPPASGAQRSAPRPQAKRDSAPIASHVATR